MQNMSKNTSATDFQLTRDLAGRQLHIPRILSESFRPPALVFQLTSPFLPYFQLMTKEALSVLILLSTQHTINQSTEERLS